MEELSLIFLARISTSSSVSRQSHRKMALLPLPLAPPFLSRLITFSIRSLLDLSTDCVRLSHGSRD